MQAFSTIPELQQGAQASHSQGAWREPRVFVLTSEKADCADADCAVCKLRALGARADLIPLSPNVEGELERLLAGASQPSVFLLETGERFALCVEQYRRLNTARLGDMRSLVGLYRDEVAGWDFSAGFDDFVLRPYSPAELRARVMRLAAQSGKARSDIHVAGRLVVDVSAHWAAVDDQEVPLTAKEFAILVSLLEHRGTLVTRDRLLRDSWREFEKTNPRMVDTHVSRLRQKLRGALKLRTIRGRGYKVELT